MFEQRTAPKMGLQNQREHHNFFFTKYEAVHPTVDSENDSSSGMLIIENKTEQFATKQNRSTEGCSKLKRSVDMTSSGKNGLNIRTYASPKWDR